MKQVHWVNLTTMDVGPKTGPAISNGGAHDISENWTKDSDKGE